MFESRAYHLLVFYGITLLGLGHLLLGGGTCSIFLIIVQVLPVPIYLAYVAHGKKGVFSLVLLVLSFFFGFNFGHIYIHVLFFYDAGHLRLLVPFHPPPPPRPPKSRVAGAADAKCLLVFHSFNQPG